MVRNAKDKKDLMKVSPSFIPSLRCNNRCSFCMYKASPENNTQLNLEDARIFVKTVDWNKVIGWGLYGGEPSIEMDLYDKFYQLLPEDVPKFIITNGSWSKSEYDTDKFLRWCANKFRIVISSCTDEHRNHQNIDILKELSGRKDVYVKFDDEELHPMGGNFHGKVNCSEKCLWHQQPIRFGLFPTGDVILQNCDGAYPIIGRIEDGFDSVFANAVDLRCMGKNLCKNTKNINDILLMIQ